VIETIFGFGAGIVLGGAAVGGLWVRTMWQARKHMRTWGKP
jgi:hypothetical protein